MESGKLLSGSEYKKKVERVAGRMTVRFYSPEVAEKFRQLVRDRGTTNFQLFNDIVESVFSIEPLLSEGDALENVQEIGGFLCQLSQEDRENIKRLHQQAMQNPLSSRATCTDVLLYLIREGMNSVSTRSKQHFSENHHKSIP